MFRIHFEYGACRSLIEARPEKSRVTHGRPGRQSRTILLYITTPLTVYLHSLKSHNTIHNFRRDSIPRCEQNSTCLKHSLLCSHWLEQPTMTSGHDSKFLSPRKFSFLEFLHQSNCEIPKPTHCDQCSALRIWVAHYICYLVKRQFSVLYWQVLVHKNCLESSWSSCRNLPVFSLDFIRAKY